MKPRSMKEAAKPPYMGLRFYRQGDRDYFAGRERQASDCYGKIARSNVLILHGRTGCGKSSFLRAGVAPRMARSTLGMHFRHGQAGEFPVIRSTGLPLRRIGETLLEAVTQLAPGGANIRPEIDLHNHLHPFQDERFRQSITRNSQRAFEALTLLNEAFVTAPIFVLDQAEEVFTYAEQLNRAGEAQHSGHAELGTMDEKDKRREVAEYFRFLSMVAERAPGPKFVISLRTEYKGQFDDQLSPRAGAGITGFYLDELDKNGLMDAIRRPTLGADEWNELRKVDPSLDETPPSERFRFSIETDVVKELAEELSAGEIPAGGVLPALQVACLRLWRQAKEGAGDKEFKVKMAQYRRLGEIQNQVQEFLSEKLEEESYEAGGETVGWREELGLSTVVDDWHRVLRSALVSVTADGRSVTARITHDALMEIARARFDGEQDAPIERTLERLQDYNVGILQKEVGDGAEYWTLGHDSIALALSKWSTVFDHEARARTGLDMGGTAEAAELKIDDLFAKGDEPAETALTLPRDYGWDGQLAHYAAKHKFEQRLGFKFSTPAGMDVLQAELETGPSNWHALRSELVSARETCASRPREHVLVATQFGVFPEGDEDATAADLQAAWDIGAEVPLWTDVLITDLFAGYGLVGTLDDFPKRWRDVADIQDRVEQTEKVRDIVRDALLEVVKREGRVRCSAKSGRTFLRLAAELSGATTFLDHMDTIPDEGLPAVSVLPTTKYTAMDPLVGWLLEDEDDPSRFIVGSTFARALADQCGYELGFGTKHLIQLVEAEEKHREAVANDDRSDPWFAYDSIREIEGRDFAAETQNIVLHTIWQVSIPSAHWTHALNRATILRLASLGYYTAEYVRTRMDEFIVHLHDFNNKVFKGARADKEDSVRGMRLNQNAVKSAFRDCFHLYRFEEYGSEIFDLDQSFAFRPRHAEYGSRSAALDIYQELISLRRRTLELFGSVRRCVDWLKENKAYSSEEAKTAAHLKQLAWNNYSIFNFYDAERYMSSAATLLEKLVDKAAPAVEAPDAADGDLAAFKRVRKV